MRPLPHGCFEFSQVTGLLDCPRATGSAPSSQSSSHPQTTDRGSGYRLPILRPEAAGA